MRLPFSTNRTTFLVIGQVFTFVLIILPNLFSLNNPFFILPFFALEIATLLPLLYKKRLLYFFFLWQLQVILILILQTVVNPTAFYQIDKASPRAMSAIVLVVIGVELLITIYFLYRERSIKPILLILSLSTTIIVFLIIFFVAQQAYPAFQENDPIGFLTGTTWQPYYNSGYNDTALLTTTVHSYDFQLQPSDDTFYFPVHYWRNFTIVLTNTGGRSDTYSISPSYISKVNVTVSPANITLKHGQNATVNVIVWLSDNTTTSLSLLATSYNTTQTKIVNITLRGTPFGVDIIPSRVNLTQYFTTAPYAYFQIINTGEYPDNYTVALDFPEHCTPSIDGLDTQWNYTSNTAPLYLEKNEIRNITVNPRFLVLQQGDYHLTITVRSKNHTEISHTAVIHLRYKDKDLLFTDTTFHAVVPGGVANFTLTANLLPGLPYNFVISAIPQGWSTQFRSESGAILHNGSGIYFLTAQENRSGRYIFSIKTSHSSSENTSASVLLTLNQGGTLPTFGILPFIFGTILTSALAILIAAPLAIGCAIFLAEYCPGRIRKILRPLYELLAGIPSVIYGLWGALTFGPILSHQVYPIVANTLGRFLWFLQISPNMSRAVLTATIVLSIMILPIILTLSEDSLRVVRRDLKEASLALGATRWQTVRYVLLPEAKSGIITSVVLATGRAIGETMAVLMILGAFYSIPTSLFDSAGTMTAVIAATLGSALTTPLTLHALFAIGLILFLIIFSLNIIIYLIQRRTESKRGPGNIPRRSFSFFLRRNNTAAVVMTIPIEKKFIIVGTKDKKSQKKPSTIFSSPHLSARNAIRHERIIVSLFIAAAIFVSIILFYIIGDIILRGGLSLKPEYVLQRELFGGQQGGFLNAIIGSLQLVGIALAFAVPLALGAAIYIQEYTKKDNIITRTVLFASDTLASTPSIVFGVFGFLFFVTYLEFKFSLIAGGLTLGIMIIPLLLRSSIEAIKAVPREYQEGAFALGASKWQSIRTVILPPASPTITSGAIISIGRAIGETAAIMFTAGYSAHIATSLFSAAGSMPNLIYIYYDISTVYPVLGRKVYAAAFILIIVVLLLNFIARLTSSRASRMMKH